MAVAIVIASGRVIAFMMLRVLCECFYGDLCIIMLVFDAMVCVML